jgi:hypothetical protein
MPAAMTGATRRWSHGGSSSAVAQVSTNFLKRLTVPYRIVVPLNEHTSRLNPFASHSVLASSGSPPSFSPDHSRHLPITGSVRVRFRFGFHGFGVRYGSALYKSRNLRTTGISSMNHMPPAAIGSDHTFRKQYLSNVEKVCFPVRAYAGFPRLAVPVFEGQPCRARTV